MSRHRVRIVDSFEQLIATPFSGDVNAICWSRRLPGDFDEVVGKLGKHAGITSVEDDDLRALELSQAGSVARDVLLADQTLLRRHGLAPSLDCIVGYPRGVDDTSPIQADVYSFHVDTATCCTDTYLCTYIGPSSEGLANELAVRRVDVAAVRARLLKEARGPDDDAFAAWLSDRFYDLHYQPKPGAVPYLFGIGNLWRIAVDYPGCPVRPCIHRAPLSLPQGPKRLLLIS